jgi:hypothetical protein
MAKRNKDNGRTVEIIEDADEVIADADKVDFSQFDELMEDEADGSMNEFELGDTLPSFEESDLELSDDDEEEVVDLSDEADEVIEHDDVPYVRPEPQEKAVAKTSGKRMAKQPTEDDRASLTEMVEAIGDGASKRAKMIWLRNNKDMEVAIIARLLGIRYQHVYNTVGPLKKG